MLGVKYKEVKSYPAGFEEIYYMYPMTFEEFIKANGIQQSTVSLLKNSYNNMQPVPDTIHKVLLKLFFNYIVVGGMPSVVQTYVNTHDIEKVVSVQREILELYRLDIAKYSSNSDKIKIRSIFDSIPTQLNDKNRRFFLNRVDKDGRYNRYENAFSWLSDAGVAMPSYNVVEPQIPMQINEKRNIFKLYMNDVGLLCSACMENIQFALLNGDMTTNMGSILENVFAQAIKSAGFNLNYYESKKFGELDFTIQNGMNVDIIEIKSGGDYKKHLAMNNVLNAGKWKFGRKIVFCKGNVEQEDGIIYLPWYMMMFYKHEEIPKNCIFKVDLSELYGE